MAHRFGAENSPFLIAGPCVVESDDLNVRIGEALAELAVKLGIGVIYKASYDKANRSRLNAPRGPGLESGLRALEKVLEGQQRLATGGSADRATRFGVEFNVRLAEAAKNEVLNGFIRSLFHRMLERVPRLYELADGFGAWDVEEHRRIYLAVRDADGERAAACMSDHVVAIRSLYEGLDAG